MSQSTIGDFCIYIQFSSFCSCLKQKTLEFFPRNPIRVKIHRYFATSGNRNPEVAQTPGNETWKFFEFGHHFTKVAT